MESYPIERIVSTIVFYALRDGATKIRLQAGTHINVHYLIGNQWEMQMKVPGFVWKDLRDYLAQRSRGWQRPVLFEWEGLRGEFDVSFEPSPDLPVQTVVLSLLPDATTEAAPSSAPLA